MEELLTQLSQRNLGNGQSVSHFPTGPTSLRQNVRASQMVRLARSRHCISETPLLAYHRILKKSDSHTIHTHTQVYM